MSAALPCRHAGVLAAAGVVSIPLFNPQHGHRGQSLFQAHALIQESCSGDCHGERHRQKSLRCWPAAGGIALCQDTVSEPKFTREMKAKAAGIQFAKILSSAEVFNELPGQVIQELVQMGKIVFAPGSYTLFVQDQVVDALYIVGAGSLDVELNGQFADQVIEGEIIGEVAVVCRRIARGTARVRSPGAYLMVLTHDQLADVMKRYPQELENLQRLATRRVLYFSSYDIFTATLHLFADCSYPFRISFTDCLKYLLIPDGTDIIRSGDEDDKGMFFVKSGKVGVYSVDNGLIATLGAGDFFGEGVLFGGPGTKRGKTVIAQGWTEVFQLTCEDFRKLSIDYPQDLKVMQEVWKARSALPCKDLPRSTPITSTSSVAH